MKTAVTFLGMLAAMASAYSPGRHLHFPRGNATATGNLTTLTTLTIKTTQVHTITSCAPTITNCPANPTSIASLPEFQKTTMVVTDTIVLTETVCPVSDVPRISSSIIAKASTGGLTGSTLAPTTITQAIFPTAPANASSVEPAAKPSMTTKVTNVVTDKTVTMTLGTGPSASVATSVVLVTVQKTITVPCSETTADVTQPGTEQVTTTTATTNITRTVTVSRYHPTGSAGSNDGSGGSGGSVGSGECVASTVTVTVAKETVTVPASTFYVAIGGSGATGACDEKPAVTQPPTNNQPVTSEKADASSDCPDETTTLQRTVPVPYPTGNGTNTSGSAQPSGFTRLP